MSSSAFTAVWSFLFFHLIHRWDILLIQPRSLQQPVKICSSSACWIVGSYRCYPCRCGVGNLTVSSNICRHKEVQHRTYCGEAVYWQRQTDALCSPVCGAACSVAGQQWRQKQGITSSQTPTNFVHPKAIWQVFVNQCLSKGVQPKSPQNCFDSSFVHYDRLVGLAVKASAQRAEDPGFKSCLWRGDFYGSSHTSDLKIDTPVATLPGAWRYRVSTGTGRHHVSILWVGEVESLICNFYLGVAACKLSVQIHPWDTLACCWDIKQPTNNCTSWLYFRHRGSCRNIRTQKRTALLRIVSTCRVFVPRLFRRANCCVTGWGREIKVWDMLCLWVLLEHQTFRLSLKNV